MLQSRLLLCFALFAFGAQSILINTTNISTILPLQATAYGSIFNVNVTFGNQTFPLLLDTGSADTWVLGDGWRCLPPQASPDSTATLQQANCTYGQPYYQASSTLTPVEDEWLGVRYGDGSVYGTVGGEDLKLGSIEVLQQTIGVVNISAMSGSDGVNVGLIGFGYPIISMIHPDSYPKNETLLANTVRYPVIFEGLIGAGMEPYVSVALERTPREEEIGFGGYLGLGNMLPVSQGPLVTVPVEVTEAIPIEVTNGVRQITEWTTTVQTASWTGNNTYLTPFQVVVDTGNPLNILPSELADAVNSAFSPPASTTQFDSLGAPAVSCNATAPEFALTIATHKFSIDSRDMIRRHASGACYSTVAPAPAPTDGLSLNFLGDAFMKNVVVVFDMGRNEMRFAERLDHATTTTGSPESSTPTSTPSPMAHIGSAGRLRPFWL
ncbi:hypothetical protein B0A48_09589 [Cryoendolithus antarcticus]|uniref:Peptidase A1 domain-containing protein n=1 Tax=Cryoendolithus antarcticus TaxID=1507870 RepID=A0A1V8SZT0_9PEZI|nr:hypothetical protein B0A48_09589 [Cryoendolithus antarcticus]